MTWLAGIGKQIEKYLARLAIYSVQDLLFHFPLRYQNRTQVQPMRDLTPGKEAVVEGVIEHVFLPTSGRTKLICKISDGTGSLFLRFFHVLSFQRDILKVGISLRCFGEVKWQKGLEMIHPECKLLSNSKQLEPHLTAIYPTTEGLTQYTFRKLISNALTAIEKDEHYQELLPHQLTSLTFKEAITLIHRPPCETNFEELHACQTLFQKRLIFEEMLAHRISLVHTKKIFQSECGIAFKPKKSLQKKFIEQLPFSLTKAQQRVAQEISQDLQKTSPMLRLVQGDVGSGKTVIAALALLQAVENGCQAALMAPTELLAEQHFTVLKKWFDVFGIQVVFLTGQIKGTKKKETLSFIADGKAQVIIGTHALFQQAVSFAKLALVVVDEQHRFGVHQRALLRKKGMQSKEYPHQLMMTATPIPRTLAMSFYTDLDSSIIDELPPGRTPVVTSVIANQRRDEIIARVKHACEEGKQIYWVCSLIEESESLRCQSAIETAAQLEQCLQPFKVGLLHGRLSATEKEKIMREFKSGRLQVLVATTVIEVGVDVPNASVMIIENAERLGLSQLHQLRGRVGRGKLESHCVLLYQSPLSDIAKERLAVMRETTDGFQIAERDLHLRGPGEILGTRQTGELALRIADLMRDKSMLPDIQKTAQLIVNEHEHVVAPLVKRWLDKGSEDYTAV